MLFRKRNNKCQPTGDGPGYLREAGFTVFEMTVVLLVIAILAGIAVPLIVNWMRSYHLGVAAEDVAMALQRARYEATSKNTLAGIVIKREISQIHIVRYDQQGQALPNPGVVILPADISFDESSPHEIDFDGRGVLTPIPTEDPVVRVNGINGYYTTVTTSPTGQVSVSNPIPQ